MQQQASALKKAMAEEVITGEAVQGMVKISMDGNQKIQSVSIDDKLLTPENKSQLEGAIKEALESCFKELQSLMLRKVQSGDISM